MEYADIRHRLTFIYNYLQPAIETGWIALIMDISQWWCRVSVILCSFEYPIKTLDWPKSIQTIVDTKTKYTERKDMKAEAKMISSLNWRSLDNRQ